MCLRIKRKIDEGAGHNEEGDGDEDIDLTWSNSDSQNFSSSSVHQIARPSYPSCGDCNCSPRFCWLSFPEGASAAFSPCAQVPVSQRFPTFPEWKGWSRPGRVLSTTRYFDCDPAIRRSECCMCRAIKVVSQVKAKGGRSNSVTLVMSFFVLVAHAFFYLVRSWFLFWRFDVRHLLCTARYFDFWRCLFYFSESFIILKALRSIHHTSIRFDEINRSKTGCFRQPSTDRSKLWRLEAIFVQFT